MHQECHTATSLYPYLHHHFPSATSTQYRKSNNCSTVGYHYRHFCSLFEYYVLDCCTHICCYKYSCLLHVSFFNKIWLKMPKDAQHLQLQHVKYKTYRNCKVLVCLCARAYLQRTNSKEESTFITCRVGRLCCNTRQDDAVPLLRRPA